MLTVIEAASDLRLTTLGALARELGLVEPDAAELEPIIAAASQAVARWCGRAFAAETVRQIFDTLPRSEALMLQRYPVATVLEVKTGAVIVPPEEIEADEAAGFLYRRGADGRRMVWSAGPVRVTYRAGYVLPGADGRTLPADVEQAALILARHYWFGRGRDPGLRSEEVDGVGNVSYASPFGGRLPAEVEGLLAPYRLAEVA